MRTDRYGGGCQTQRLPASAVPSHFQINLHESLCPHPHGVSHQLGKLMHRLIIQATLFGVNGERAKCGLLGRLCCCHHARKRVACARLVTPRPGQRRTDAIKNTHRRIGQMWFVFIQRKTPFSKETQTYATHTISMTVNTRGAEYEAARTPQLVCSGLDHFPLVLFLFTRKQTHKDASRLEKKKISES